MLALRPAVLLCGLAAFVGFSLDRFSDSGGIRPPLDLMSQAERIADPARRLLAGRLAPGVSIGCVNANPDWLDECDYFYYTLLPDFIVKIPAGEPTAAGFVIADGYIMFVANPHASQSPQQQASAIPGYRVELELPQGVFLLTRSQP